MLLSHARSVTELKDRHRYDLAFSKREKWNYSVRLNSEATGSRFLTGIGYLHLMSFTKPATDSSIDWARILSDADHRWAMGLRVGDLASFFQSRDPSGLILVERVRWLSESPGEYAALQPSAEAVLQETVELARSLGAAVPDEEAPWAQLLSLGRAWESDFVWMVPQGASIWSLAGGVVCFPSSWSLPEKLGQPMQAIHAPVPGLNDALEKQIETFLHRMQPGQAWVRENVGFSGDDQKNHLPSFQMRRLDATETREEVFLRIEHQLLYKLPISGAILFGIRVEVVPLLTALRNPMVTARLGRLLKTISPEAAEYKGLAEVRERMVSWFQ